MLEYSHMKIQLSTQTVFQRYIYSSIVLEIKGDLFHVIETVCRFEEPLHRGDDGKPNGIEATVIGEGVAVQDSRDQYVRLTGCKIAYARAIENGNFSKAERGVLWAAFAEMHNLPYPNKKEWNKK